MINQELRQLAKTQSQLGNTAKDGDRSEEAAEKYLLGLSYLKAAYSSDFQDKHLLSDAFAAMTEAISLDRQCPDPYVSVAFLHSLLGEKAKARHYLREALRLAPDHQEALELQNAMEKPDKQSEPPPEGEAFLSPLAQIDADAEEQLRQLALTELLERIVNQPLYDRNDPQLQAFLRSAKPAEFDELYDYVESQISQFIESETRSVPQLSLEPLHLEEMALKHALLVGVYQVMDILLQAINEDIDVSELKTKLRPVRILLQRMEKTLRTSGDLAAVRQRIKSSNQHCKAIAEIASLIAAPADAHRLEGLFEKLLDECDQIADAMDQLESQGISISLLDPAYEQMLANIQGLQEHLDEKLAAIGETTAA